MSTKVSPLYSLFGSKTRTDLLVHFLMHPGEFFYVRQLAGLLAQSATPVARELLNLENLGLLKSETKANAKYFSVNQHSPLFADLQSLIIKTAGAGEIIKKVLGSLSSITFAFIYGSFASQTADVRSDIDLFLIGNLELLPLSKIIREMEKQTKREIQYSLFGEKEFLKKLKEGNDFLRQVVKGPKIMLVGNKNEFKRFTQRRLA